MMNIKLDLTDIIKNIEINTLKYEEFKLLRNHHKFELVISALSSKESKFEIINPELKVGDSITVGNNEYILLDDFRNEKLSKYNTWYYENYVHYYYAYHYIIKDTKSNGKGHVRISIKPIGD